MTLFWLLVVIIFVIDGAWMVLMLNEMYRPLRDLRRDFANSKAEREAELK